jgi:hypothetical protein
MDRSKFNEMKKSMKGRQFILMTVLELKRKIFIYFIFLIWV